MSHTRHNTVVIIILVFIGLFLVETSRADLIRLSNGQYHAGHILEETSTSLRLKTGEPGGPREITISSQDIGRIYRVFEEAQQIDQCKSAARLQQWAAAYYHSELVILAKQCLEQAWKLDPSIGVKPLETGTSEFRTFWNRFILKQRSKGLKHSDARGLAGLARWAYDAKLKDEATFHLRRAWIASGKKKKYATLAQAWQVNLESWIELDLKPALGHGLFENSIRDENSTVAAEPGKVFVILPIWYDRRAAPQTLSKSMLRGTARQGFYGIRLLQNKPDLATLLLPDNAPIYERVELRSKNNGPPQLVLKNNLGPRINQGNSTEQQRLSLRPETGHPSNWALVFVEVPEDARQLALDWSDGGGETIDLTYLKIAHAAVHDSTQHDSQAPGITEALNHLESRSGAVAELAITQLEWMKKRIPPDRLEEWSARVDKRMIKAGARIEEQVRSAAWGYFASSSSVSRDAQLFLAGNKASIQAEWINIIRSHNKLPETANFSVATQLLSAILKTEDEVICDATLDALIGLNTEVDWNLIGTVSEAAQLATLDRLHLLPKDQTTPLLLNLMKSVRPSSAVKIAQHARSLDLGLADPHDPILAQWPDLKTPAERRAFFKVVGAADLGDLIYSHSFATIMRDATQPNHEIGVRHAAISAIIHQIKHRMDRPLTTGSRAGIESNFPVLISVDSKDPVIDGLTKAVASKSHPMQLDALEVLLIEGYAEQAEKGLITAAHSADEWNKILNVLIGREGVAQSNGFLALLGRLLKIEHADKAGLILSCLKELMDAKPDQRRRILIAVKAGVEFAELSQLAVHLKKPESEIAKDLLYQLGHLSSQDRQRLEASMDQSRRLEKLKRIDLRRAQLVDGRYNAVAVVEATIREADTVQVNGSSGTRRNRRWQIPRRITVTLPSLTIRSSDKKNSYQVFWGQQEIGRGLAREDVRNIRGPASFSPRLVDAGSQWLGPNGWGWSTPTNYDASEELAWGPAVLGSWPVLEEAANTMTLELADYLRAGLREAAVFGEEDLKVFVPDSFKMTLRYAAFASYYGVGTTRSLPRKVPSPGTPHLLNVMLILDKE